MAFASGSSAFAPNNQSTLFGAPKPAFGTSQPAQQQPATGGLFGQPAQQQQATGGLFGQPAQQQPTTGGLFGQPPQQQQQQPQQSGGLFGQPTQQQPSNTLFGQSTGQQQQPQQQQQQPAGGFFGQSTTAPAGGASFGQSTTQPAGGGLFGQSTTQPAASGLFGQPSTQPAGGGIFGQSTTQPAGGGVFGQSTTQPAGGGIFGQPTTQPAGGGLFGQSTTQPAGGLFGQPTQQQPQQGSSIFGTTNTQQQPQQQQGIGLFGNTLQAQPTIPAGGFGGGGKLFGSNQQQQQNLGLSNAYPTPNGFILTKATKFNDLPDELKRTLEFVDSHIQGRIQISKDLHQRKLGDEPLKAQQLLRGIQKDFVNTSTQIRDDLHFTKDMKAKVEQAVQDTIVATRIVDGAKAPQGSGGASYLKDHANFPLEFFSRATDNMKQRLAWYKSTIEQIERKLASSAGQSQTPHTASNVSHCTGISATLQAQHETFLSLANKTAALDAELQKIKTLYTQLWRAKTGSVRDPFNELDRTTDAGDYGMQSLGVK
ncbi:hypothetical protein FPV67DRAFT_1651102 [Lyophyllum atratum]|nr:hypothetical protein FPV67DRAFT_1651102 [Lyophyllum atratum]